MFKKNKFLLIMCLVLIIGGLFLWIGQGVKAESAGSSILSNLIDTRRAAELPETTNPIDVVAKVIQGALGLVAIIFFIMIIIAGFRWMTAGGNEETITNAKKNISNAIVGLVVILFSYAVTYFIFKILLDNNT